MTKLELLQSIYCGYSGARQKHFVEMNNSVVFLTESEMEAELFRATLVARILLMRDETLVMVGENRGDTSGSGIPDPARERRTS